MVSIFIWLVDNSARRPHRPAAPPNPAALGTMCHLLSQTQCSDTTRAFGATKQCHQPTPTTSGANTLYHYLTYVPP